MGNADWLWGVLLGLAAGIVGAVGKVLLKTAHLRYKEAENQHGGPTQRDKCVFYATQSFCVISIFVLNPVFSLWAYTFAAASLLAPFAGLPIAWNALLAPCVTEEVLTRTDILGAALILSGTTMEALAADHTEISYMYEDLVALYSTASFIIYAICVALFFVVLGLLFIKPAYRPFALGALSGTVGGFQFLTKSVSELLANDIASLGQSPGPWLIIIAGCGIAGGGIALLNKGLATYDALFMIPLYQSFVCLSGAVGGLAYFQEYENMEPWQFGLYFPGLATIVAGVVVINKHRSTGASINNANNKEYNTFGDDSTDPQGISVALNSVNSD